MSWFFIPLTTAAISAAFGVVVLRRFLDNAKRHNLLWSVGLFAIAVAALCQALAELAGGWSEPVFRVYYFSAGVGPALWGAGTMYLVGNRRAADVFLYAMLALIAAQAVVCAVLPLDTSYFAGGQIETGVKAAATPMRVLIALMSSVGAIAMIVGALLSFRSSRRIHNLLIALGAIVFSAGGTIAGLFPEEGGLSTAGLYLGNLAGIVLVFVGFWMARTARTEASAATVAAAFVAPRP